MPLPLLLHNVGNKTARFCCMFLKCYSSYTSGRAEPRCVIYSDLCGSRSRLKPSEAEGLVTHRLRRGVGTCCETAGEGWLVEQHLSGKHQRLIRGFATHHYITRAGEWESRRCELVGSVITSHGFCFVLGFFSAPQ